MVADRPDAPVEPHGAHPRVVPLALWAGWAPSLQGECPHRSISPPARWYYTLYGPRAASILCTPPGPEGSKGQWALAGARGPLISRILMLVEGARCRFSLLAVTNCRHSTSCRPATTPTCRRRS